MHLVLKLSVRHFYLETHLTRWSFETFIVAFGFFSIVEIHQKIRQKIIPIAHGLNDPLAF